MKTLYGGRFVIHGGEPETFDMRNGISYCGPFELEARPIVETLKARAKRTPAGRPAKKQPPSRGELAAALDRFVKAQMSLSNCDYLAALEIVKKQRPDLIAKVYGGK